MIGFCKCPAQLQRAMVIEMDTLDTQGLVEALTLTDNLARIACVIGGATLPLFSRYLLDQSGLFQSDKDAIV